MPAGGQLVLAQPAVEDELEAGRLDGRGGLGQLVEQEDPGPGAGQEGRRAPHGRVRGEAGQAPEVDRVEEGGPEVEEVDPEGPGGVPDHGRLADPGRAPEVHRAAGREDGREDVGEFGRAHQTRLHMGGTDPPAEAGGRRPGGRQGPGRVARGSCESDRFMAGVKPDGRVGAGGRDPTNLG